MSGPAWFSAGAGVGSWSAIGAYLAGRGAWSFLGGFVTGWRKGWRR